MKRLRTGALALGSRLCWLPITMTLASQSIPGEGQTVKMPPPTRVDNVRETLHGVEIADPYRWLEEQNSPQTREWIGAQNTHTKETLGAWPGRRALEQRIAELLKIDVIGEPTERGGYYYFSKRLANQDQPVWYRRKGPDGTDETLIDPNTMSADKTVSVRLMDISEDGAVVVYGVQQGGEDEVVVHFLDAATRKDLPDTLSKARYFGGVAITPDKRGVYYGRMEAEGPRVRYHAMGTEASADKELFGKGYDPGKIVSVGLSEDGRYLSMTVFHGSAAPKTEVYVQNVAQNGPITTIVNDIEARFSGRIVDDYLYLQTNWNAPNNRILRVDLKNPARDKWEEIVPAGDAVLQGFSLVGGKVYANLLENVTSRLRVYSADGKPEGEVKLPALGTVGGLDGRWHSKEAFYTFTSFAFPTTIYRYDLEKKAETIWARIKMPVDPDNFEVKQVFYPSKDGTKIPMFLVHAKGLKLDGSHPTYLTGYGGFNQSLTPRFSAVAALWAERGGVFAIPNLRGGGEFGEAWHRAGMLEKKQNVFDDFIGAAEWLIQNHYTQPAKLAIAGGSNGGLLVGAALTQRPELFGAVVCSVPLLDMLRYHKFLVARFWVPEYGSADDPEQFKTLYAYSPYHHVKAGTKYPATLFVTGDADTRVAPLHARKMAALLQAANASDKPILLHYDTKAGHSGGKPINKQVEDLADEQSFLFWQLGIGYPGK